MLNLFSHSLDQQIQRLIDEAPEDGKTPQAMAAIAPSILQRLRSSLAIWNILFFKVSTKIGRSRPCKIDSNRT